MSETVTETELPADAELTRRRLTCDETATPVLDAGDAARGGRARPRSRAPPRPIASGPVGATGRRKQAIARVRLVPGTGTWTINGRTLEDYFPNKVHQQIVNEPFVTLDLVDRYDVLVRVQGGGISVRPARFDSASPAR